MDARFLRLYNRELQFVREMGGEFARAYPKVAGRLTLDEFECADPYVERLLEGFAFLAARVQLQLDNEFPRFTQHLLECLYPDYLAPLPSMAVVQLRPDHAQGSLMQGFALPRHTTIRSILGKGDRTACDYLLAHDVRLWPLTVSDAGYLAYGKDVAGLGLPMRPGVKAAVRIRLRLEAGGGAQIGQLPIEDLPVYLRGGDEQPMRLYEQLLGNAVGMWIRSPGATAGRFLPAGQIRAHGFDENQALLPAGPRTFQAFRLLREYFAFPQRFAFVLFAGLGDGLRACGGTEVELIVLLDRSDSQLEDAVTADNFALCCAPAVNLFRKRADRIHLDAHSPEYHVVADRTRPMDFEVHSLVEVTGYGADAADTRLFRPLYSVTDRGHGDGAYYVIRREPRRPSERQRRGVAARSSYAGSEVFLSLVDADHAPYHPDLKQLGVELLCTNRDLPLQVSLGQGRTDFTLEEGAPVASVRALAGPTAPAAAIAEGEAAWRLIGHLSLAHAGVLGGREDDAGGLRELLSLYADLRDPAARKQVEGIRAVHVEPVFRRLPLAGPIAFARGLEVRMTCDESDFEGIGTFLLGSVLDRVFARMVSINSFTETVLRTSQRGEVMRWPMRSGTRTLL